MFHPASEPDVSGSLLSSTAIIPGIIRQMPATVKGREGRGDREQIDRVVFDSSHLADSFAEGVIHVDRSVNWIISDSLFRFHFLRQFFDSEIRMEFVEVCACVCVPSLGRTFPINRKIGVRSQKTGKVSLFKSWMDNNSCVISAYLQFFAILDIM